MCVHQLGKGAPEDNNLPTLATSHRCSKNICACRGVPTRLQAIPEMQSLCLLTDPSRQRQDMESEKVRTQKKRRREERLSEKQNGV